MLFDVIKCFWEHVKYRGCFNASAFCLHSPCSEMRARASASKGFVFIAKLDAVEKILFNLVLRCHAFQGVGIPVDIGESGSIPEILTSWPVLYLPLISHFLHIAGRKRTW